MSTSTMGERADGRDVDAEFRPWVYTGFGAAMRAFCRVWHRFELRGTERVPEGPCLFVGNHSGIGITDVLCLLGGWTGAFGTERRVVGMMHDLYVRAPVVGWFTRSFGAVHASPSAAKQAFARGYDVACFPGGDIDSLRPLTAAREVRFGPRRGYIRLALEQGVPIVPIATLGSHYSYLLLPGGGRLARAVGADKWMRTIVLPITPSGIVLALAVLGALAGFVPLWIVGLAVAAAIVPNPVRVTSEMLEPIDVCAATAHIVDHAERIERAHELVHGALARHVRTMQHDA